VKKENHVFLLHIVLGYGGLDGGLDSGLDGGLDGGWFTWRCRHSTDWNWKGDTFVRHLAKGFWFLFRAVWVPFPE
jgi:hypothetical protein